MTLPAVDQETASAGLASEFPADRIPAGADPNATFVEETSLMRVELMIEYPIDEEQVAQWANLNASRVVFQRDA